jgi:hypothetical protein
MAKLTTEQTIPTADESKVRSCSQDEVLQPPMTPVTPVTAEDLASLHILIEQDAHALDQTSKDALKRHLQKFANATQTSFADTALLQDRAQFLTKMNNEAKVHRSIKSVVLGKTKVIIYEDLEKARANRAAREQAKVKGDGNAVGSAKVLRQILRW